MASITVRFFGPARDAAGADKMQLELAAGATLGAAAGKIAAANEALAQMVGVRLAVNRKYVPLNHVLKDGDEVAMIPLVSGG